MEYRNNPLAPPWMWSGSYCEPAGVQDEYFIYVLRKTLTGLQRLNTQPFLFDGDGCFLWRVYLNGTRQQSDGPAYFAWRDQLGRQLSNQLMALGVEQHPMVPIEFIEPGARWSYDVENTSADPSTIFYALIGVKRRKVAG